MLFLTSAYCPAENTYAQKLIDFYYFVPISTQNVLGVGDRFGVHGGSSGDKVRIVGKWPTAGSEEINLGEGRNEDDK